MRFYRLHRKDFCKIASVLLFLSFLFMPYAAYADSVDEYAGAGQENSSVSSDLSEAQEFRTGADEAQEASYVPDGAWYDEYVEYVLRQGYMRNIDDENFGADEPMTRAMFVSALYSMADTEDFLPHISPEEKFGDVDGTEWFSQALTWAYEKKIIRGMNGDFCPDLAIDREMIAVMIQRASSVLEIQAEENWSISVDYTDLEDISDWAVDGIAYCTVCGIMSGDPDGSFAPKRSLTRAEGAAIIVRIESELSRDGTDDPTDSEILETDR